MRRGIIRDILILILGYYVIKTWVFSGLPREIIIITLALCLLSIWFVLERIGLM